MENSSRHLGTMYILYCSRSYLGRCFIWFHIFINQILADKFKKKKSFQINLVITWNITWSWTQSLSLLYFWVHGTSYCKTCFPNCKSFLLLSPSTLTAWKLDTTFSSGYTVVHRENFLDCFLFPFTSSRVTLVPTAIAVQPNPLTFRRRISYNFI